MNGRSVLIVDDDREFLAAVTRVLRGAGYQVRTAPNGSTVKDMVVSQAPDLVITDIMMPEHDGVELIGELRRTTRGIRILAVSGRGYIGALDLLGMAKAMGADAVMAKPFESDELLAKVSALIPSLRDHVR
jgi:DNA-binding response OmpR family regulator